MRLDGNKEGQQMDKWLVNMTAGATLSALLVIFGANTFFDIVYPDGGGPEAEPEIAATAHSDAGTPPAVEEGPDFSVLLASASAESGAKQAKKCAACHSFDAGGADKVGPNLYNVVGRDIAGKEGFAYSSALTEFGGQWDYERLNCFLTNPKKCVPNTKMSFAGVKKDGARADLIAYLKSVSPDAPPLPAPAEAASAEPATETSPETTAEDVQPAPGGDPNGASAVGAAQN